MSFPEEENCYPLYELDGENKDREMVGFISRKYLLCERENPSLPLTVSWSTLVIVDEKFLRYARM